MSPATTTSSTLQSNATISGSTTTTQTEAQAGSGIIALGQQLYIANCSVCHGTDAQGIPSLGTSLVESTLIDQQSDAEALAFIRRGRPADDPANTTGRPMPPSGAHPELTDEEILAIVTFLRNQ
jgi:disulfide bond formation protein DsbB